MGFILVLIGIFLGLGIVQAVEEELDFMVLGVIASTKSNEGFALLKQKSTGKRCLGERQRGFVHLVRRDGLFGHGEFLSWHG